LAEVATPGAGPEVLGGNAGRARCGGAGGARRRRHGSTGRGGVVDRRRAGQSRLRRKGQDAPRGIVPRASAPVRWVRCSAYAPNRSARPAGTESLHCRP
jgi:hypothetical protein